MRSPDGDIYIFQFITTDKGILFNVHPTELTVEFNDLKVGASTYCAGNEHRITTKGDAAQNAASGENTLFNLVYIWRKPNGV